VQTHDEIRRDLPSDLDRHEADALVAEALGLQALRPAPDPDFRHELRAELLGEEPRRTPAPSLPHRNTFRALAAAYALSGAVLLAIAAAGLAGTGPFAPS
jgi:hypothetical protein